MHSYRLSEFDLPWLGLRRPNATLGRIFRLLFISIFLSTVSGPSLAKDPGRSENVNRGKRADIAREHLRRHHQKLGLELRDVEDIERREHESKHNSTTHMNLRQRVDGIAINGANMGLAVDRRGSVFGRWNHFVPGARSKINRSTPQLSALEALDSAALQLGLPIPEEISIVDHASGPQLETTLSGGNLARDPIRAKLVYQPKSDQPGSSSFHRRGQRLRLAWDLVIRTLDGRHWWNVQVDAVNGDVLGRTDWISRETYRAFAPIPVQSPDDGPHILVSPPTIPGSPAPSPQGWHDNDGIPGAEYTDTRGNNVHAQEDTNADDTGGFRPDGGAGLVFDFPFDANLDPSTYQAASITNLFYWNNVAHDLFYMYGFDEESGNFQLNNYGRGGTGGDPVVADAQDGAGLNNAQFGTPPDGFAAVMEMFLFSAPVQLEILSPPSLAGMYPSGGAEFGPTPPAIALQDDLVEALDAANATGPTTTDACTPLTNASSINGKIALVDRGSCNFTVKVANAESAGAIAVIVVNNAGDGLLTMGGVDPSITIPSLLIGQTHGTTIRSELPSVTASISSYPLRDGSLDAGIILHEYGHGVTNRLTGGASNASCLSATQSSSMGEGWSDFFSLFAGAQAGDTGADPRGMGTYPLSQPRGGNGIRSQPYSTDMTINTTTLADIGTAAAPHGIGEIWASSLWEIYWQLVNAYGFDSDIYAGYTGSGGGNLALQLVMDGLKLQPCNPTFIEARDALLLAEANLTEEANRCLVWRGFAKRGLGANATVSANPANVTATEDFTLPATCEEFCADGALALSEECDDSNLIELDGCSSTCRIEESYLFQGIAQGGTVEFVVDGISVLVLSLAGETPAEIALKMANAINADSALNNLGALAHAVGDSVVVSGDITASVITDLGLSCGDGLLAPIEQCEDSNLTNLDGCSSTCRLEESYLFQGVAQGGTVEFVVEGETISITTVAGETAADVAVKMASAITLNPTLSALGVVAQGSGNSIVVAGDISSTTISDPGLAPSVPFSNWIAPIMGLLLLISGIPWLTPFQRRPDCNPNSA